MPGGVYGRSLITPRYSARIRVDPRALRGHEHACAAVARPRQHPRVGLLRAGASGVLCWAGGSLWGLLGTPGV